MDILAEYKERLAVGCRSPGYQANSRISDDTAIDHASNSYVYLQVADAIATRITDGQYPIKLPSERDLAAEFGVSYPTVRHAMAILRERGLIVSVHGRGTYVARRRGDRHTALSCHDLHL